MFVVTFINLSNIFCLPDVWGTVRFVIANEPVVLPPSRLYGNVIRKGNQFKYDTSNLAKSLKNLINKIYDLATIVGSLRQIFFVVELVSASSNKISTVIFHCILCCCFIFNIS